MHVRYTPGEGLPTQIWAYCKRSIPYILRGLYVYLTGNHHKNREKVELFEKPFIKRFSWIFNTKS